ncbi:MAG: hypothetical protein EU541_02635 [Promethearchaeota archaeon]|nr:MAG: hypothetical protein EU541_02635 [Candidatus Lokiarchaeota archaeon]
MSDLLMYIKEMISDLIYVNSVIATELTKITENLAAIRHGEDFIKKSKCIPEHEEINRSIMNIVRKYKKMPKDYKNLEKHVLDHED